MVGRPLFAQAFEAHRSGRLEEAAGDSEKILADDPSHIDSLHMLGVIEQGRKNFARAETLIRQALAPGNHPAIWRPC